MLLSIEDRPCCRQDWAPSGVGRFPTSKDSGGECGQVTTRQASSVTLLQ